MGQILWHGPFVPPWPKLAEAIALASFLTSCPSSGLRRDSKSIIFELFVSAAPPRLCRGPRIFFLRRKVEIARAPPPQTLTWDKSSGTARRESGNADNCAKFQRSAASFFLWCIVVGESSGSWKSFAERKTPRRDPKPRAFEPLDRARRTCGENSLLRCHDKESTRDVNNPECDVDKMGKQEERLRRRGGIDKRRFSSVIPSPQNRPRHASSATEIGAQRQMTTARSVRADNERLLVMAQIKWERTRVNGVANTGFYELASLFQWFSAFLISGPSYFHPDSSEHGSLHSWARLVTFWTCYILKIYRGRHSSNILPETGTRWCKISRDCKPLTAFRDTRAQNSGKSRNVSALRFRESLARVDNSGSAFDGARRGILAARCPPEEAWLSRMKRGVAKTGWEPKPGPGSCGARKRIFLRYFRENGSLPRKLSHDPCLRGETKAHTAACQRGVCTSPWQCRLPGPALISKLHVASQFRQGRMWGNKNWILVHAQIPYKVFCAAKIWERACENEDSTCSLWCLCKCRGDFSFFIFLKCSIFFQRYRDRGACIASTSGITRPKIWGGQIFWLHASNSIWLGPPPHEALNNKIG